MQWHFVAPRQYMISIGGCTRMLKFSNRLQGVNVVWITGPSWFGKMEWSSIDGPSFKESGTVFQESLHPDIKFKLVIRHFISERLIAIRHFQVRTAMGT